MNVLIACEFSGIIRDAFCKMGHNSWSCDLLPSEKPGNHFQCDIFDVLYKDYLTDVDAFQNRILKFKVRKMEKKLKIIL